METQKRENIRNLDITKNLDSTVAMVKDIHKTGSSYVYYYNDVRYIDVYHGEGESKSNIGKFFKVEISKKNPQYSRLIISREITDPTQIKNSHFRKKTLDEILDAK